MTTTPKVGTQAEPVNKERGEVALFVPSTRGGELGQTYVLRMGTNALAKLEDVMGDHIHKLAPRLMSPRLGDMRAMLCAALGERHPEITLLEAGNIIDRAGYDAAGAALVEALNLGFPKGTPGKPESATGKGESRGMGTGTSSSSTRRKRASGLTSSGV